MELCAFDGETWIRVAATLVEDQRAEAQESMFTAYPSLRDTYTVNDGNSVVYYLKDVIATFDADGEPKVIKFWHVGIAIILKSNSPLYHIQAMPHMLSF